MSKITKQTQVMEPETIQKNGVSLKDPDIRSRRNRYKNWRLL